MGVKVKVDLDIGRARVNAATEKANHLLAQQVRKDTEPFVPALTGSLAGRATVKGSTIQYPGPYARFLYYGKVMIDPETGSPYALKGATKTVTNKDLVFNKSMHQDAQAFWFEASKAVNLEKWLREYGKAVRHYL